MSGFDTIIAFYYSRPTDLVQGMSPDSASQYAMLFAGFSKGLDFISQNVREVLVNLCENDKTKVYEFKLRGRSEAVAYAATGFLCSAGVPGVASGDRVTLDAILQAFSKKTQHKWESGLFGYWAVVDIDKERS